MAKEPEYKEKEKELEKIIDEIALWLLPKWVKNEDTGKVYDEHSNNFSPAAFLKEKYGYAPSKITNMIADIPWLMKKYDEINEIKEAKLINQSLTKKIDGNFAKFLLVSKWKYTSERSDSTHQIKDFDIKDLIGFEDDK